MADKVSKESPHLRDMNRDKAAWSKSRCRQLAYRDMSLASIARRRLSESFNGLGTTAF